MKPPHTVRLTGYEGIDKEGTDFTYGLRVYLDGEELRGVKSASLTMSGEAFALVTLTLAADVEVDARLAVNLVDDRQAEALRYAAFMLQVTPEDLIQQAAAHPSERSPLEVEVG